MIRALRGPIMLITIGVLFALNNFTPYQFYRTWPVLLIVGGLLSLLGRDSRPPQPPYGNPPSQGPNAGGPRPGQWSGPGGPQ